MAFVINQTECIGCGACAGACPVTAIDADADKYKIDAGKCTDCGDCSDVCPVTCITGTKKK